MNEQPARTPTAGEFLQSIGATVGAPPCGGCTRCCLNVVVRLLDGVDDPESYLTQPHPKPDATGALMLARKRDHRGEVCVYLGETGCTIHDRAPSLCKQFDCRVSAVILSATKARKRDDINLMVWRRGRDLVNQLKGGEG